MSFKYFQEAKENKKDEKSKDKKDKKEKEEESPDLSLQQCIILHLTTEWSSTHIILCSVKYCCAVMFVAVAVLGVALIAMGEDIGSEMAFRSMGHLVSEQ